MELTPKERLGSNFSYDSSNKTVTIDLNDLSSSGDLDSDLGLGSGLLSFESSLSNRNARQILWVLLLLSYHNQPNEAEDNSEVKMVVYPLSPQITDRGGSIEKENSLQVSTYTPIGNQSTIISPGEIQ